MGCTFSSGEGDEARGEGSLSLSTFKDEFSVKFKNVDTERSLVSDKMGGKYRYASFPKSRKQAEIELFHSLDIMREGFDYPCFVPFIDLYELQDEYRIVFAYFSSTSLDEYIQIIGSQLGSHSHVLFVQKFACALCSSLRYLHSRRIIHNDMRPSNCLIGKNWYDECMSTRIYLAALHCS